MKSNARIEFVETPAGVVVRSLLDRRRGDGDPQTMMRTGKWPSGARVTASDSYDVARWLRPVRDKRAAK